jgi:hypothetical protein
MRPKPIIRKKPPITFIVFLDLAAGKISRNFSYGINIINNPIPKNAKEVKILSPPLLFYLK